MKRCLSCNASFESSLDSCPQCGNETERIDGFDAYATELAYAGGGFDPVYFSELAELEDSNFWFRARNSLILWALKTYLPNFESFLEIGCGTGYVLSGIATRFPQVNLYGSEIFVEGLGFAASRSGSARLMQMDARNIPFACEFDAIGAFDVIEHIEEDELVLAQIYAALNPGGIAVLSVPQHEWLWSSTDDFACHVRRYRAPDLKRKIENAGFRILRSTSFVSTLLPAMMLSRLLQKNLTKEEYDPSSELKIAAPINFIFRKMLEFEIVLISAGVNFPVGGSRLVIAQKP